jgi:hypothetical protein
MRPVSIAAVLAVAALAGVVSTRGEDAPRRAFAHNVYFTLNDASPQARQKLVDACRKYLSGHAGTLFFAAGTRQEEMRREVNDKGFDVSLHVYFTDKAAHDAYQEHARHRQFIEEMKPNWKTVRVFDSWVELASR